MTLLNIFKWLLFYFRATLREIVGHWLKQPMLCLLVDQEFLFLHQKNLDAGSWQQDHLVRGRPRIDLLIGVYICIYIYICSVF